MKRWLLTAMLAALALLLCGCAASNPLVGAEATEVPGLSMALHPAAASDRNANELAVTLYFRYYDEPMLAPETRVLTVRRDESAELAVVNALLKGPSAGGVELTRLFPQDVQARGVKAEGGVLYVTLSDAVLRDETIPDNWTALPEWRVEAPLRRRLAIQSLVCTLTESFPYPAVQVMVQRADGAKTTARLENSYFLSDLTGLSDPQRRDESVLLTPSNTAARILDAYAHRDFGALYLYVAVEGRPLYEDFAARMDASGALTAFAVSAGAVAEDGRAATLTAELTFLQDGAERAVSACPMRLARENGVWKIAYDNLAALVAQ